MFGATNIIKIVRKESMYAVVMEKHFMEKVNGVLVLIIVHHLILITKKNDFLILGEKDTFGINGSFGASEKK